ncbi:mitochondrial K+-H+ exchange-related-domain-containing protein [Amylostereum chailletii]|nr:mitochondrial K+-H+ exchange-related-domain-containing protein [Amylostereum chailletii]
MSVLKKVTLPMRIIAFPLTKPVRAMRHASDHPAPLVYYHFQMPPKPNDHKPTWTDWITGKASSTWASLGKAPENTWKFKAFHYGERLIDRIEFEELALKGLDPSLGPTVAHPRKADDKSGLDSIPLVHPKFLEPTVLPQVENILARRTPRHRKGFWTWLLISPLTAPFMIIRESAVRFNYREKNSTSPPAVIPNFPFFFCVWRSWSHYRAFKGSEYLESLLKRGAIVPQSSPQLDEIYAAHAPSPPPSPPPEETGHKDGSSSGSGPSAEELTQEKVLLTREAVPPLLSLFGIPSTAASDFYRAIEQANVRLAQGLYK